MLMGRHLLHDMDIAPGELDHRNFQRARDLAARQSPAYLSRAENEIGDALARLFRDRERTLQRVSATFRRADLVDDLLSAGDR